MDRLAPSGGGLCLDRIGVVAGVVWPGNGPVARGGLSLAGSVVSPCERLRCSGYRVCALCKRAKAFEPAAKRRRFDCFVLCYLGALAQCCMGTHGNAGSRCIL